MKRLKVLCGTAVGALVLSACGADAPNRELMSAREAFQQAQREPTTRVAPKELHIAQDALRRAERMEEEEPNSPEARHLAYIAERRAQLAMEIAEAAMAEEEAQKAQQTYESVLENQAAQATEKSAAYETDLQRLQQQQALQQQALQSARAMMERQQPLFTLSGSVIFKVGSAELLPTAQNQLRKVAEMLKSQGNLPLVIEGHTDSSGDEEKNQQLSQQRAESVRDFLIGEGVPAERLTAVGQGESQPLATNDTPEGRANNRRVEIRFGEGANQPSRPGGFGPGQQQGTPPDDTSPLEETPE